MQRVTFIHTSTGWTIETAEFDQSNQKKRKFNLNFLKKVNILDKFFLVTCLSILLIAPVNDTLSAIIQAYINLGRVNAWINPKNISNQYNNDQKWVISEYIRVGRERGESDHKIITALTIAAQESGYRSLVPGVTCNVDKGTCNDDWYFAQWGERSDSWGTRQGRESSGYSKSCMLDPACTAKSIYDEFDQISNADNLDVWQLAAKIQRPAKEYEYHYQYHVQDAQTLLAASKK